MAPTDYATSDINHWNILHLSFSRYKNGKTVFSKARVCLEVTEKAGGEIQHLGKFAMFHKPTVIYEST